MNKKNWLVLSSEEEFTSDELYQYLLESQSRIFILSGKSGCGKTSIIRRLKAESGRTVNSVNHLFITNYICRQRTDEPVSQEEFDDKINSDFFCVEDVDFLAGMVSMQEVFGELMKEISTGRKIIITGIELRRRVPELLETLGDSCEEIIYAK